MSTPTTPHVRLRIRVHAHMQPHAYARLSGIPEAGRPTQVAFLVELGARYLAQIDSLISDVAPNAPCGPAPAGQPEPAKPVSTPPPDPVAPGGWTAVPAAAQAAGEEAQEPHLLLALHRWG